MSSGEVEEWENEGGHPAPFETYEFKLENLNKPHLHKFWGKETERSLMYFNIGNDFFDPIFISTLINIKKYMAQANHCLGLIDYNNSEAIINAADYLLANHDFSQFPTKIWQTGSGTQINMNANEVLASIATELSQQVNPLTTIHPNDHVNMSQSSNDVIPTALNISATKLVLDKLMPQLTQMELRLKEIEEKYSQTIKVGRTHFMDAVPMSLGQEFGAFKSQIVENKKRLMDTLERLKLIPLGGTAIGTGMNCPKEVSDFAVKKLSESYGMELKKLDNLFCGIAASDSIIELSGQLKTLACSLLKMANDIIILSSGPNTGINEIILPYNEAGSSIMPGKVNPTQCEALSMVCCQVIGNDSAITLGGMQGRLQLNTFRPLLIKNILHSIHLLSDAMKSFNEYCLKGLRANAPQMKKNMEESKMIITAINSIIGYDKATKLIENATFNKTSVAEEIIKAGVLTKDQLEKKLNADSMIHPPPLSRKFNDYGARNID